jgi:hypothetical protein
MLIFSCQNDNRQHGLTAATLHVKIKSFHEGVTLVGIHALHRKAHT